MRPTRRQTAGATSRKGSAPPVPPPRDRVDCRNRSRRQVDRVRGFRFALSVRPTSNAEMPACDGNGVWVRRDLVRRAALDLGSKIGIRDELSAALSRFAFRYKAGPNRRLHSRTKVRDIFGTHFVNRAPTNFLKIVISREKTDAGGGTRTTDTRIMIMLRRLRSVAAGRCFLLYGADSCLSADRRFAASPRCGVGTALPPWRIASDGRRRKMTCALQSPR